MKTFKVITSWTGYSEITVQAETKQEAENLVANDEYDTDNEVLTGNGVMSKVYVVIDEFYGTIADVNVYKNKPKNLKTISEDESQRCFELEIKDSNDE
jgi:hypothetical protein